MSFSIDKEVALRSMNRKIPKNYEVRVLYILLNTKELNEKNITNAEIYEFSNYKSEKEVLLFPFSFYEINSIKKENTYYKIYLNYIGKFRKLLTEKFNIRNEADLLNHIQEESFESSFESLGLTIPIYQSKKGLCKIFSNHSFGMGYFLMIPLSNKFTMPSLITNSHLIDIHYLKNNKKIEFEYDNILYQLLSLEKRKIYINEEFDITIIEIKDEDNIKIKNFLEIDEEILNIKNFHKNYVNSTAYIFKYKDGNFTFSLEEIQNISEEGNLFQKTIKEKSEDNNGSSRTPILSLSSFKVIGLHCGFNPNSKMNIGYIISRPIKAYLSLY